MGSGRAYIIILAFTVFSLCVYWLYFEGSDYIRIGYPLASSGQVDEFSGPLPSVDPLDIPTVMPPLSKKSFRAAPIWDFDDVYRLSPKPRQTTCTESIMNSEDPEFVKAFLPDIELLLKRQSLSISEWNRLAHFNNPFGFMEYNYTVINSAIQKIPQPEHDQLLSVTEAAEDGCIRCAVVANGGILNGSGMGKEIDAHDYVFRVNGAITAGHEKDVGNRTSVYVHTVFSLVSSTVTLTSKGFQIPHDKGIKYVLIPEGDGDFNFLMFLLKREKVSTGGHRGYTPHVHYNDHFNESRYYILHPDFLRYVKNRFLMSWRVKGPSWAIYRPTNGAFTLFLAMHTCDIVSAYGYSTLDYKNYTNYYYDSGHTKMVFVANHDHHLEIETWKKFHDKKLIRLYHGKDNNL